MACAQCHTHKYDPLSHEEYFQIFAILNQTEDRDRKDEAPTIQVDGEAIRQQRLALNKEIADLHRQLRELTPGEKAAMKEWEQH